MTPRLLIAALGGTVLILGAPTATASRSDAPRLDWHPCTVPNEQGFDCATIRVPRDYERPHQGTIHLAVIRHRAADPARRVGTLFFNPGGPGCCAITFVPKALELGLFGGVLRNRFDIVSWDTRGTGNSTAVQCFASRRREDRFLAELPQGFPVGPSQKRRWVRTFRRFGRRCGTRNGSLLRHISTADTARDLNRLRRALGTARLNYLGISYGTFLGATYANLFPDRVRAMVLDGNVNPRSWIHRRTKLNGGRFLGTELRLRSDRGTARTLDAFLELCGTASTSGCTFSAGSPAATRAKFAELLRRLRRQPANPQTGYAAVVQETEGLLEQSAPLGGPSGWSALAEELQQLWAGSDPSPSLSSPALPLLDPAFVSARARGAVRRYDGPEQQYAIYCSESPNPRPAAFWSQTRIGFERSGAVGRYWSWLPEPCGSWPAKAAYRYTGPWSRRTRNPVLVIGNTHDPSTPYRESKAMVRQLARARLLTVDGYGHTEFSNPSSCASRYESRYLIGLTPPPAGVRCRQDYKPFTGSP